MSITIQPDLPSDVEPPDVYYTNAFAELGSHIESDHSDPIVITYRDGGGEIHMQCLERTINGGPFRDLTTPYGYGGPLFLGEPDAAQFAQELADWAVSENIVSAFIRFDPIQRNHTRFLPEATLISNVVLVPTTDREEILANLSPRYRKQYRRALRDGMETHITYHLDAQLINEFRDAYEESMNRVEARESYYFPDAAWTTICEKQEELGASISRTTLSGVVHATALRFSRGQYAYNFLSATSDIGRRSHATEVDKINFCLHAQETGRTLVNFGGGLGGGNDTLLEHKKRFAPNVPLGEFYIGKLVFIPNVYHSLSGRPFQASEPFPAYRFNAPTAK